MHCVEANALTASMADGQGVGGKALSITATQAIATDVLNNT
jgi:hypothetical protein